MSRKKEEVFLKMPVEIDLEKLVNEVIEINSKLVLEYRAGIASALEKLVSVAMKKSFGRADPTKIRHMIISKL